MIEELSEDDDNKTPSTVPLRSNDHMAPRSGPPDSDPKIFTIPIMLIILIIPIPIIPIILI